MGLPKKVMQVVFRIYLERIEYTDDLLKQEISRTL